MFVKNKKSIISLICVLLWMCLIFYFSSQTATESSGVSVSFTKKILSLFTSDMSNEVAHKIAVSIDFFVRKMAHFTIFSVLGFLVRNLMTYIFATQKITISIIICALYSISDEVHQIFVPGRACRVYDIAIDTIGAATGVFAFCLVLYIYQKIKDKHYK